MKNEYSVVYNPWVYESIIRTASEIIWSDISDVGYANVVFSNTDSIGIIGRDVLPIEDLISHFNSMRTYVHYKLENHFTRVKFINVNKYAGIT